MNFAFPAFLIFFLLLPGLLLRHSILRGRFRRTPVSISSIAEDLTTGILFSFILHSAWLAIAHCLEGCTSVKVDFGLILALLAGQFGKDQLYLDTAIRSVQEHPLPIAVYFGTILFLPILGGHAIGTKIRKRRLDVQWPVLRLPNDWHYFFQGEDVATTKLPNGQTFGPSDITMVYIAVLVDLKDASYLYWGTLTDWWFDKTGNLERLRLDNAYRRKLESDRPRRAVRTYPSESRGRYYKIEGDGVVLRYSDIRTMNIEYIYAVPESDETVPPVTPAAPTATIAPIAPAGGAGE